MPELPEVQTIINGLQETILDQRISHVDIFHSKTLFCQAAELLKRKKIVAVSRKGKYIVIHLEDLDLIIHLRMTGQFFYFRQNYEPSAYDRVVFHLNEGLLVFRDVRKFATMVVAPSYKEILSHLGIDPTTAAFSPELLKELLKKAPGTIKSFLLDQKYIAGLGNIYVDEALFKSGIHPGSIAKALAEDKVSKLHEAITFVLAKALNSKGTSLGSGLGNYKHINGKGENSLFVYGQKVCPRCLGTLEKIKLASRGTTFCAACQPL